MRRKISGSFSAEGFYYGLLPPIVYAAGLNLQRRDFFRNFASILLFAILGTFISAFSFALGTYGLVRLGAIDDSNLGKSAVMDCLLYGVLISAIDPVATLSVFSDLGVPSLLHNLVLGESVVNDAIVIVLFRTMRLYYDKPLTAGTIPSMLTNFMKIALGSCGIGLATGLICSYVLRTLELGAMPISSANTLRPAKFDFDTSPFAISILVLSGYLAYLLAESSGMSGIMALFLTGIVHAHYAIKTITNEAQSAVRQMFEAGSFLSETFVFAYLGMQVAINGHQIDLGLILSSVPLMLLTRAINIFPLANLANSFRRFPIPANVQTMQFACGLRGAIAYALALNLPSTHEGTIGNPAIETATLFTVFFTTIIFGGATGPLLSLLGLSGANAASSQEGHLSGSPDEEARSAFADGERDRERSKVHQVFREVDNRFLKPIFGGTRIASEGIGEQSEAAYVPLPDVR